MPAKSKGHRSKSHESVRATYDAAQTTNNNKRRWQYTDALSANQANSRGVRHTLMQRSRYECSNNTYASGIIETVAQDCIGTGPRLQMSGNEQLHKEIEKSWREWCRVVGYTRKLITMKTTKSKDGEIFGLRVSRPNQKHPVKLYIQLFEAEQIQSHNSVNDDVDGVHLDEFGEPREYRLLDNHPGSLKGVNMKGRWINADRFIHFAHLTRAGQVRGVPEITPALELFAILRAYTLSVLTASETAANISALMYTDAGANDESDEVDPELTWEIERNTLKALPFGWKLAQLKAEQPTNTYPDFKAEILNEISRCLHVPYNIAAGNSSGYNYASGRLDHTRYFKSLEVERYLINTEINDVVFAEFLEEWARVFGVDLRSVDLSHSWQYDAQEHVDPVKTANARAINIKSGVSNRAIEASKEGRDWEEVLRQQLQEERLERELRDEMGLPQVDKNGDIIINEIKEKEDDDEQAA